MEKNEAKNEAADATHQLTIRYGSNAGRENKRAGGTTALQSGSTSARRLNFWVAPRCAVHVTTCAINPPGGAPDLVLYLPAHLLNAVAAVLLPELPPTRQQQHRRVESTCDARDRQACPIVSSTIDGDDDRSPVPTRDGHQTESHNLIWDTTLILGDSTQSLRIHRS